MATSTEPNKQIILITGGAGFIGSHVCDRVIEAGHTVHCLDDLSTGKRENVDHLIDHERFTFVKGDLRELDAVLAATKDVGKIVHLGALGSVPRSIKDPMTTCNVNLLGTLHILEAARQQGIERVVYASSSSVYGDEPELPKKEHRIGHPLSPYAVTKAMDEVYARLFHRMFQLTTIGLRFFNVFGERQDPQGPYAAAIPRFMDRLMRGLPPQVHGSGSQTRDFTYVANAVEAVMLALAAPENAVGGQVFNVACGESRDLLSLIDALKVGLVKMDPSIESIQPEHVAERAGDVEHSLADISKSMDLLGYSVQYDLAAGLERAIPWYWEHWRKA